MKVFFVQKKAPQFLKTVELLLLSNIYL